ncbi:30S ribosomal protein S3 [Candidatus Altiarchaeota archaeon]
MAMEKHFIQEGVIRSEIESYLQNELNRAGYSGINIQKTPLGTRVTLFVEKPPLVIGRKGKRINEITTMLKEKYNVENPEVDVQRIEKPILDPNILARRIAVALERGMNRRRIAYKAIRAVMSAKARGVEIVLSGKITGKGGRSRNEKYSEGYMKKAGDSLKLVKIGSTQANLKAGVIGVTAKIVLPDTRFPDQIGVLKRTTEEEKVEEAVEEKVEKAEEKKPVKKEKKEKKKTSELTDLKGLGAKAAEKLAKAEVKTIDDLSKADVKKIAEKSTISEKKIEAWKAEIEK